jgi:hypothetical protein
MTAFIPVEASFSIFKTYSFIISGKIIVCIFSSLGNQVKVEGEGGAFARRPAGPPKPLMREYWTPGGLRGGKPL